jgi:predicted dienelactone hydrolase
MDCPLSRPAAVPDRGTAGPCRVSTRLTLLHDPRRARNLPLKLYLPDLPRPKGLILFSHGLGGTREGGATWLNHWASHGFAAIALQHPGSDASLLHNNSPLALRRAFKAAMNPEELAHRVEDMRVVIKHVGHDTGLPNAINGAPAIGIAGHSFGAVTVQILAGERRPDQRQQPPDPRIRAALAFSPSARFAHIGPGLDHRFGHIHLPFISLTGSRDDGMGLSDITAANRELPFHHMPADHGKYLLVFANGTHLDFAGQASEAEGAVFHIRRNPPLFRDNLLAASTAYWQAHLNGDSVARHWLTSDFPGRLRPDDRFEHK